MNRPLRAFFVFASIAFPGFAWAISASSPMPSDTNVFVLLSRKVVPSVVNISTLSTVKSPYGMGGPDDLFRQFFEEFLRRHGRSSGGGDGEEDEDEQDNHAPHRMPKAMSLGTGFII